MLAAVLGLVLKSDAPYASATPIKEPVAFADGVISTEEFESHPQFSPDGKTLYFVKSTPQFTGWTIYVSNFAKGSWSKPVLAPFSGKHRDADPFITPDGKRLFFISDRPAQGKTASNMDVWYMEKTPGGWGAPQHLGPEVNSDGDEWFPTLTKDGTLYFGSPRKGGLGGCDIWRCKPKGSRFQAAVNLGANINTAADEIEPFITSDGKTLIFNSDRPGSLGGLDFFVSRLGANGWEPPRHLDKRFNSPRVELSPKVTPDGHYFLFTKLNGRQRLGDIMIVDAKEVLGNN